jgi:hypothetical protein
VKIYTVHCDCPTPLAANPYSTLAANEQIAIKRFYRRNGISGTDHKITVTEGTPAGTEAVVDEVIDPEDVPEKTEEDHIRDYLVATPGATNREVVAAMKAQKISVTSTQVTAVKKSLSEPNPDERSDNTGGDQDQPVG